MKRDVDVDEIEGRLEEVRETFNALADFILLIYNDMDVDKRYWSETCSMISTVHMQLLTMTKKNFESSRDR